MPRAASGMEQCHDMCDDKGPRLYLRRRYGAEIYQTY